MERRRRKEHFLLPGKKRSVGGKDHPEALLPRHCQKFRQVGVAQGLAHNVKVKKIRVGVQFGQQLCKILRSHPPGLALRPGTECAA